MQHALIEVLLQCDKIQHCYFWRREKISHAETELAHHHLKFSRSVDPAFPFLGSMAQCSMQRASRQWQLRGSQQQQNKFKPHWAKCPWVPRASLRLAVQVENSSEKSHHKSPSTVCYFFFLQNLVNINVDSLPAGKNNNKKGLKLGFSIHPNSSIFQRYEMYKPGAGCMLRRCNFQ